MTKKISQLSAAVTLTGPEQVPIVQSGATVRTTAALLNAVPRAISTITSLQAALDGKVALAASQTITGTTSFRSATAGSVQVALLDSTGSSVAQIRARGANVGIGGNALIALTSGEYNVAIGNGAMDADTSGYHNVAIGLNALGANTMGFQNTAIGSSALASLTGNPGALPGLDSTNNTGIGANAGEQLTTGHRNVAIGVDALWVETTGWWNVAIGVHAVNSQVGVAGTVGIGYSALLQNVTGIGNVGIGQEALATTTVGHGTAIGFQAAGSVTTGVGNTAVGYEALAFPNANFANRTTTGAGQVAIGAYTGQAGATPGAFDYGVAVGYQSIFGYGSLALGAFAVATHTYSVGLGYSTTTTADSQVQVGTKHIELGEIADPAASAANSGRLYTRDNGSGKTQLVVKFATGAVQVIATEP